MRAVLALLLVACARGGAPPAQLEVHEVGAGGAGTVVLLHGFGAPGDDLVPLARALATQGVRFVLPVGPHEAWGGRSWFELEPPAVPRGAGAADGRARARERPPGFLAIRRAVGDLVGRAGRPVAVGGFSQGAMLAAHVALASEPPPACALLFSPAILDERGLRAQRRPGLRVFVSHGRADRVLPVAEARRLVALLEEGGAAVTYLELDGGHTIAPAAVEAARDFLGGCLQGAAGSVK